MNIELTKYQAKVLWAACNAAQSNGVRYLMQYETDMFKDNDALADWYLETLEEYYALREVKNQLGRLDNE